MQVVDVVSSRWPISIGLQRGIDAGLGIGFFVVLLLAWYHGEKGRQRVSGPELLLLTLLLGIGGGLVGRAVPEPAGAEFEQVRDGSATRAGSAVPLRRMLFDNPAIAVLPLANFGADEDGRFVDGLHDDILAALQKIGGLTVISRTSVQQYRETEKPVPVIARELGVDALVEGSISRAGGRIRVNVQLIDASTDAHLWSDQYDRELTAENVFAIRSEIAVAVAAAMKTSLTPQEEAQVAARPTTSLSAYDWLQISLQRPRGSAERIAAIQEALKIDPASAVAWGALATDRALSIEHYSAPPEWAIRRLLRQTGRSRWILSMHLHGPLAGWWHGTEDTSTSP